MEENILKSTEVPQVLPVAKLLEARAQEIHNLENFISQTSGSKLIFQNLPRHMRRRTMSHNVKRLPRRIREAHRRQMEKCGTSTKQKRPSRRFRRRPKNLMADYVRRQREKTWLETHIWHAKRFHMVNRWGYRLPDGPCDKAFRACYRASAQHCLIQDISYVSCVEIQGSEPELINLLKLVTSKTGLSIGARAFLNGSREGSIVFYHKNSYPFEAIGEVNFMWKSKEMDSSQRYLWLWLHPAFYTDLLEVLLELFSLKRTENNTSDAVYENATGVKLTELKFSLNRFRLTGPLTHPVLKNSLCLAPKENTSDWLTEYLQQENNQRIFEKQSAFWNLLHQLRLASELSPRLITSFVVTDPRYNFPKKRTKAKDFGENAEIGEVPPEVKFGPLWCADIRKNISKVEVTTAEFIKERKNQLMPYGPAPLNAAAIPVFLVQQPGNRNCNLGYGAGWDIILPANWSRPFWLSFIMRGARAGGLRESTSLRLEQGLPDFLAPDSKAGQAENARISQLYREKFFRLPPKNRVNYTKMGIFTPFEYRWKTLIQEWNPELTTPAEDFFVMRDRKKLELLQELLSNKKATNVVVQNADVNFKEHCLVPVRLNLEGKGRVKKYGIICLPQNADFKKDPIEPLHKDENQVLRKDLRDAHLKLLKKIKRQRIRARKNNKEISSSAELIQAQASRMRDLWLPNPKVIRSSCTREICGFVTNGDFSFTTARSKCVGYVALSAFPTILSMQRRDKILVRNTTSRQYRFSSMEVICS